MSPIRWLTSEDVMGRYNVSRQTFHRWRRLGQLPPPHSKPGTKPQWREDMLDAFDGGAAPTVPMSPADLISVPALAARLGLTEVELWNDVDLGLIPEPVKLDPAATRRTVCTALNISEQTCLAMEKQGELPDFTEGTIAGFDPAIIAKWDSLGRPAVAKMQDAAKLAEAVRPKVEEALRKLRRSTRLSNWLIRYLQASTPALKLELTRELFQMAGMTAPPDHELRTVAQALN